MKYRMSQIAAAKIRRAQVGVREVCTFKVAVAQIGGGEIRSHQPSAVQVDSLQKGTRDIDADERHTVGIQFLQGFHSPSTASFALRGVNALPGLIVFLLCTVAR